MTLPHQLSIIDDTHVSHSVNGPVITIAGKKFIRSLRLASNEPIVITAINHAPDVTRPNVVSNLLPSHDIEVLPRQYYDIPVGPPNTIGVHRFTVRFRTQTATSIGRPLMKIVMPHNSEDRDRVARDQMIQTIADEVKRRPQQVPVYDPGTGRTTMIPDVSEFSLEVNDGFPHLNHRPIHYMELDTSSPKLINSTASSTSYSEEKIATFIVILTQ